MHVQSFVFLLTAVAIHAAATAQTSVLPARSADKAGNSWEGSAFPSRSDLPTHTQLGYAPAEVGRATGRIVSLTFRRSNVISNINPDMRATIEVAMSHGPNAPSSLSAKFAANEGGDRKVVFRGTVHWPKTPKRFDLPKFVARIPLQTPFAFDRTKGPSLVLDIKVSARDPRSDLHWFLDASEPDLGKVRINGVGGAWGVQPLPIAMKRFGATGCEWSAASVAWFPMVVGSNGLATLGPMRIPRDPKLAGKVFFDQAALIDPRANPLGLRTLTSWRWTIGSGRGPNGSVVSALRDKPPAASGFRRPHRAVIVQLGF